MSRGLDQCTQEEIMHNADVGPRSEIGKIGSRHSFLRAMHVSSLQLPVHTVLGARALTLCLVQKYST